MNGFEFDISMENAVIGDEIMEEVKEDEKGGEDKENERTQG